MAKPSVAVDYRHCQASACGQGACQAAVRCAHNILRQEAPFEAPEVYPGPCRGCALCVPACPYGAIRVLK